MSNLLLMPAMVAALCITTTFMFALRPLARSIGLVDRPGGRKSHVGIVPIVGGLAMFVGVFSGMIVLGDQGPHLPSLIVGSMILVAIGALDDKYALPASVRLAAQVGTVLIMIFGAGLSVQSIGNPIGIGDIGLGPVALVFTMLVSLTVINAYNLIDGVDGLAGSLALLALLAIALVGGIDSASGAVALTIAASVIGFLVFNFPVVWNRPVRSFMGDAGSTFLGFVIVWTALGVSQGADRAISPVYCLWFASIPIYDLLTCLWRRVAAGKSPLRPGRDHFHHALKRGGMGVRQVLGIMTGVQLIYILIALVAFALSVAEPLMFAAWLGLGLCQRSLFLRIACHSRLRGLRRARANRLREVAKMPATTRQAA